MAEQAIAERCPKCGQPLPFMGKLATDPRDYRRLCCSCHKRVDGIIANITGRD